MIALIWANSPWAPAYLTLLDSRIILGWGEHILAKPLLLWINDGLMAVFFFVVGLEIKRELSVGELATSRKAALPVAGALGGMAAPAILYAAANLGRPEIHGWGVPMATDIAFALGVLTLLGPRIPPALKVFLAALAIVDDIGAVVVIALFYSSSIALPVLMTGLALLGLSALFGRAGVRSPVVYGVVGLLVWLAFLKSGIHATVAGVLLAMTVPAETRRNARSFRQRVGEAMSEFGDEESADDIGLDSVRQSAVASLERACEEVQSPLQRMEQILHPWVSHGIMPLFALANAGVPLGGASGVVPSSVPIGIAVGLLIGKPLGITLASLAAVRLKLAELPAGVTIRHLIGAGILGGIGFTMAIFVAGLAYSDGHTLASAKAAILATSTAAGALGYVALRGSSRPVIGDEKENTG